MGHFRLSDKFFEKIRMRNVKAAMRDMGMDTNLTIYDAASSIEGYCPVRELASHDVSHMVSGAFKTDPELAAARGKRYADNVMEGQAVEVDCALFGGYFTPLSAEFNRDIARANAHRNQNIRIAKYFQRTNQDEQPQPHFMALGRERLHALIERALDARGFFTATMQRQPADMSPSRLLDTPLSFFGVHMAADKKGAAQSFDFYTPEQRRDVIATLG